MRLRMLLGVFAIESRKLLTYRLEFWANTVLSLFVAIGVPYCLWHAIFEASETSVIRGYSLHGILVYYGAAALIGRIVRGADLIVDVSTDIYEGALNRYLMYPAAYLPLKYAQYMGNMVPHFLQLLVIVPLILAVVGIPEDVGITLVSVACCLASIAVGSLLYYLLLFPLQCVAFWADNVWSLAVLLRIMAQLLGGALVPLAMFPDWARPVVELLPFQCVAHLPVNALTGQLSLAEWAQGMSVCLVWCGVMMVIGRLVWRRGMLGYSGVGI